MNLMPKVALYNISGQQVGEVELKDSVFGIEPNEPVLHDAVTMQLANQRQGTHDTKTRAEVRGGGRKPGGKKVPVVHVLAPLAHLSGVLVVSCLDHIPVIIPIPCPRKYAA
ncbi:hypothetical protein N752_10160 [Desulforamulus aquiferis]|nr:hypothetical protein N752_10160 [Desulforamulus aquiferis]